MKILILILLGIGTVNNQAPYLFSPEKCIYKISFPQNPIISKGVFPANEIIDMQISAEYILKSEATLLRAEFILLNVTEKMITGSEKERIINNYAFSNGLSNVNISLQESKFGTLYKLRGFKYISAKEKEIPVTYTADIYFKLKNIFIVYAGCPSKMYPTNTIASFQNSLHFKK